MNEKSQAQLEAEASMAMLHRLMRRAVGRSLAFLVAAFGATHLELAQQQWEGTQRIGNGGLRR